MEVRPVPQFDPEHPQMISQGPSICVFNKANSQEVLASWLFTQYMLTNEVQLGYAETEGYLPVTTKAQDSPEYRDYVSRKGEDNQDHYFAKIEASELLRSHTADTFVTPVFNGSASVRSAAGQLIEEVTKGARRKKEMNDDFIRETYGNVRSLFRLDQIQGEGNGRGDGRRGGGTGGEAGRMERSSRRVPGPADRRALRMDPDRRGGPVPGEKNKAKELKNTGV